MEKNINIAGYDLYEITKNEWIMHVKGGPVFAGEFKKVVIHAVTKLGFELGEIEIAVQQMLKNDHNGAHFGTYKSFIYSFRKDFKYDKQAS